LTGPSTEVFHDRLDRAAKKATDAGQTISSNLQRLLGEIQSHQASFQGVAGSALQNVSADLGQELRNIVDALNTMAEKVHASNKQLGATDQDAGSTITNVAGTYQPTGVGNALRG
jgi:WXG100 family type VII secretion target